MFCKFNFHLKQDKTNSLSLCFLHQHALFAVSDKQQNTQCSLYSVIAKQLLKTLVERNWKIKLFETNYKFQWNIISDKLKKYNFFIYLYH